MERLSELTLLHEHMDHLFLEHQCAILRLDWSRAFTLLQSFKSELEQHIAEEEDLLLPTYERNVRQCPGGTAELFRAEHRKIKCFVNEYVRREEAFRFKKSGNPVDAIALLDAQAQFKHLLAHHDQRERSFLYPALDQKISVGERLDLIHRIEERRSRPDA